MRGQMLILQIKEWITVLQMISGRWLGLLDFVGKRLDRGTVIPA